MKTIEQIFQGVETNVKMSISSVFTKDDVLNIMSNVFAAIKEAEQPQQPISTPNILASDFANFTSKVREKLSYYLESSDIVDYDSAEFEVEYNNHLTLSHVQVDLDSWTEEFDTYMLDNFTEIFGDDSIIADK
jgi:hypothetical protein